MHTDCITQKLHWEDLFSLANIKNYLRISHDYDDQLIQGLINAAIEYAEKFTSKLICKRTIVMTIRDSCKLIKLPNLAQVIDIQALSSNEDIQDRYGKIDLVLQQIKVNDQFIGSDVRIKYLSSDNQQELPSLIKQGLLTHIMNMYEYTDVSEHTSAKIRDFYASHRRIKI